MRWPGRFAAHGLPLGLGLILVIVLVNVLGLGLAIRQGLTQMLQLRHR